MIHLNACLEQEDFEMAGIMVAHSVLLGGPSLSCLSPVMYSYVLSGSADTLLGEYPVLDDVPRNA